VSRPPGRHHGNAGKGPGNAGRSNTGPPPGMRPQTKSGGCRLVAVPVALLLFLPLLIVAVLADWRRPT
jgi:hypothetical protein